MYGKNRSIPFINHGYSGQMYYRRPEFYQSNIQQLPRSQPYPYQTYGMEWYPYQQQNPYYQQPYQPQYQPYETAYPPGGMPTNSTGQFPPKNGQFLFQNPLQPQEEIIPNQMAQMNGYQGMNPYPKPNGMIKQPGGIQSLMNSFKSQDGTVDVNKMVNTAGQMVSAVSQVSSLVKGLGGIFKT